MKKLIIILCVIGLIITCLLPIGWIKIILANYFSIQVIILFRIYIYELDIQDKLLDAMTRREQKVNKEFNTNDTDMD